MKVVLKTRQKAQTQSLTHKPTSLCLTGDQIIAVCMLVLDKKAPDLRRQINEMSSNNQSAVNFCSFLYNEGAVPPQLCLVFVGT